MQLISRRRIMERKRSKRRAENRLRLLAAAGTAAACFLISRACFLGNMSPAGAAMMAVMVSLNPMNLYLLPFMLMGICSTGSFLWGDVGALWGCAFVFLCAGRIRLAPWHKAVIAGAIIMISQSICCIAIGADYPLSVKHILLEGTIGLALCSMFDVFLQMTRREASYDSVSRGILSLVAVTMVAVSGLGFPGVAISAAMIMTLLAGYLMGVMEGLLCAFVSGFLVLLFGGSPGTIFAFMLGGIVAGLFHGKNKLAAGLCFILAVMGAEALDVTSISLAVPDYGPVLAGGLLILLPQKWIFYLDIRLSSFLQSKSCREKKNIGSASEKLEELQKTFDNLSALFVSQDNRRILLSYQFQVMSRVLGRTVKDINRQALAVLPRYKLEPAWASYAKNQDISGDTHLWAQLPDGRFAVILSDGMGKGKAAAAESSLTATTIIRLLETGLEVELVLKLLNQIMLLNVENEVFSTVDLGIFNQRTGRMRFYKIGAAATFIKRRRSVDALNLSAMPMGIVDGLKVDCVTTSLRPGDQVIMISDGVTDSRREDLSMEWLKETIGSIRSRDPQTMCDLIMNQAVENYGIKEKDDLTVLAMRVS